ncbi:MAG: hypothetical protein RhofKO_33180 [Rhodothermales bacterium]
MSKPSRASIALEGSVLRFAEVEAPAEGYRLARLGSCDFETDIGGDLLSTDAPSTLATVQDALRDMFGATEASMLTVVVPPTIGYATFVPVRHDASPEAAYATLHQDVALLAGSSALKTLEVIPEPMHTAQVADVGMVQWYHAMAVPKALRPCFQALGQALDIDMVRMLRSTRTAAALVHILHRRPDAEPPQAPYTLGLGWYPTHVEYIVCHGDTWHYSHHTEAGTVADAAYFAISLLKRLRIPPLAVGRLYVYGSGVDLDAFRPMAKLFNTAPLRLDPLHALDLDREHLDDQFAAEAFAPCIGAAL